LHIYTYYEQKIEKKRQTIVWCWSDFPMDHQNLDWTHAPGTIRWTLCRWECK